LQYLFEPLRRAPNQQEYESETSLGLGLYIVSEIAKAHHCQVEVRSDERETAFAVRLPRKPWHSFSKDKVRRARRAALDCVRMHMYSACHEPIHTC
jgi:K+-sensing histidine kinase KdpD